MKTRIKPLEPPDSIHLKAAAGWLGLGNHIEANEELENITPQLRAHPDVLEMRWQIYAKAKQWEPCVDIARAMTKLAPSLPQGWINLGFSLRRAQDGGLQASWEALLPVAEKFPTVWLIPYNLACYAAQMQRMHGARDWLKRAIDIAEKIGSFNEVRLMALQDPDLEQLWQEIPPPKIRQGKYL